MQVQGTDAVNEQIHAEDVQKDTESKVVSLQKELAASQARCKEVTAKAEQVAASMLNKQQTNNRSAAETIASLNEELAAAQHLGQALDKSNTQAASLNESLLGSAETIASLNEEIAAAQHLQEALDESNTRTASLNEELATLRNWCKQNVKQHVKEVKQLRGSLKESESQAEAQVTQLKQLCLDLKGAQATVLTQRQSMDTLQEQRKQTQEEFDIKVTRMNTEVQKAKAAASTLFKALQKLKGQLSAQHDAALAKSSAGDPPLILRTVLLSAI